MQIAQTREQISALRKFQNYCEILNVSLLSCSAFRAKASSEIYSEPFSLRPQLSNVINSQDGGVFLVEVSFEYSGWDSSEPPQRIFSVNSTFEVSYRVRDNYVPTEEERSSFSKGTAVFHCWPYAREFFRDITSRMGHTVPPLPLLRITPKKSEQPAEPSSLPAPKANQARNG
jgi:hypothetical protein